MLRRCYNRDVQRVNKTYTDCYVDQRWHKLSEFAAWYDVNYRPGFELDKDIIVPGNKVYGPDTCVFVPPRLNLLLTNSGPTQTGLPRGVKYANGRYVAKCQGLQTTPRSKSFDTVEEAAAWYRAKKSQTIRRAATDALANREIDLRTHLALLRHAVLIEFG